MLKTEKYKSPDYYFDQYTKKSGLIINANNTKGYRNILWKVFSGKQRTRQNLWNGRVKL